MDDTRLNRTATDIVQVMKMPRPSDDDLLKLRLIFKECVELRAIPYHERGNVLLT